MQLIGAAAMTAGTGAAEARPFLPGMSCADAKGVVASNGAIALDTSAATFERFVVDRRYCGNDEYTNPAVAQTRDSPDCVIGYVCQSYTQYPRKSR